MMNLPVQVVKHCLKDYKCLRVAWNFLRPQKLSYLIWKCCVIPRCLTFIVKVRGTWQWTGPLIWSLE